METTQDRILVSAPTLKAWNQKKKHRDQVAIMKQTGLSLGTIANAFKGIASQTTIDTINKFYNLK